MNKKEVCGEFPDFCYKGFDLVKYAEQFMNNGTFRMGCLRSYRKIEDESRRDPTEGSGHTKEPGIVTVGYFSPNPAEKTIWTREKGYQEHHIEAGNQIFCFCTCSQEVNLNYMSKRFKYVVKINNPKKFAEDINDYFFNNGQNFLIWGCKVVYNKGQKLEKQLATNERLDLPYKQKDEKFHDDCEFRIVAIKRSGTCASECKFLDGEVEPECKSVEVDLGKKLNYLSLVNLK